MNPDQMERQSRSLLLRVLMGLVIVASVLLGATLLLVAVTLGSCSAFGGRCPADRPPLIDDDTFGTAAAGAFLIVAIPTFVSRPSRRRLGLGIVVGLSAAIIVGLVVRSIAYG